MNLRALVFLYTLSVSESFAMSLADRDVKSLLEGSTAVIEGRVMGINAECEQGSCVSKIKISVEKEYKDNEGQSKEALFCSWAPLTVGAKYIFFIEQAQNMEKSAGCEVIAERDGVFKRFGRDVYRYMSPGSFEIAQINGKKYLTGWVLVEQFDALVSQAGDRR